jgi:hypothetical protein
MSSVINDIEERLADLLPTLENLTELCGTRLTVDPAIDRENSRPEEEIAREVLTEARSEAHDLLFALRRLAMTRALYPRTVSLRAALQRINRRISKSGLRVTTARSAADKDAGRFMLIEGAIIRDGFENVDELSDYARLVGVLHDAETIVENVAQGTIPPPVHPAGAKYRRIVSNRIDLSAEEWQLIPDSYTQDDQPNYTSATVVATVLNSTFNVALSRGLGERETRHMMLDVMDQLSSGAGDTEPRYVLGELLIERFGEEVCEASGWNAWNNFAGPEHAADRERWHKEKQWH